jgi:adenylylsulfate kinase-like enzyme
MTVEIVTREEKEQELLQKAKIVVIIGQPNDVRNVAYLLERRFFSAGILSTVIDSDNLSKGLCQDCISDNTEFLRRTIEAAKLFLNTGFITICYGTSTLMDAVNNLVNKSDFIVVTTNEAAEKIEGSFVIELGQNSLEDVVHGLYKKLATVISA